MKFFWMPLFFVCSLLSEASAVNCVQPEPLSSQNVGAYTKNSAFVEVRGASKTKGKGVVEEPSRPDDILFYVSPGQVLQLTYGDEQKECRRVKELKGQGQWVYLNTGAMKRESSAVSAYVYDNWRDFALLGPAGCAPKMKFRNGLVQQEIAIFIEPLHRSWEVCRTHPGKCEAIPPADVDLVLLESQMFFDVQGTWDNRSGLYYRVQYRFVDEDKKLQTGEGWVYSEFLSRVGAATDCVSQISFVEESLLRATDRKTRMARNRERFDPLDPGVNNVTPKTPEEALKKKKERILSIVNQMAVDEKSERKFGRWYNPKAKKAGQNSASKSSGPLMGQVNMADMFSLQINIDLAVGISHGSLVTDGDKASDRQAQGVEFAVSGVMPILLDLEASGTLSYQMPLTKASDGQPLPEILRFQQEIMYTAQSSASTSPWRIGVGWNLLVLSGGQQDYAFGALVGLRGVIHRDSPQFLNGVEFGLISNSKGDNFPNFQGKYQLNWRLDPSKGYDSLQMVFKAGYLGFKNSESVETKLTEGYIGILQSF